MPDIRSEYRHFKRWQTRFIMAAMVSFLVAEGMFDIVERALGRYLVWQNTGRERIGRTWQEGENRLTANTQLEQITRTVRERLSAVEGISDFEELVEFVNSQSRVVLTPEQFNDLYQELSPIFRALVIPPEELMTLHHHQGLANIVVERQNEKLQFLLLNAGNQVIRRCELTKELTGMLVNHGKELALDVRTAERFSGHVLTAAEFFEVLDRQFVDDRDRWLEAVPVLTDVSATVERVAFANSITAGFVETAFALDNFRARVYYLPEEWTIDFIARTYPYEVTPFR